MNSPFISVTEAARYLGISKTGIYRIVDRKEITCAKFGSRILFKQEWLDAYINASTIRGGVKE